MADYFVKCHHSDIAYTAQVWNPQALPGIPPHKGAPVKAQWSLLNDRPEHHS